MKTPEEIKKDAEICLSYIDEPCNSCVLFRECGGIANHIINELYKLVIDYEQRLAQAERERAVLMWDARGCHSCKHIKNGLDKPPCDECTDEGSGWEWRGVCEENSR